MVWVKALHIVFMMSWFAGLFYLPRLFVYHAQCEVAAGDERFKLMERKLYRFIAPWAALTVVLGVWMLLDYAWATYAASGWLHAKLMLVLVLIGYHLYCGKLVADFRAGRNRRSHIFYRWFNELPVLLLLGIVLLAVGRPF